MDHRLCSDRDVRHSPDEESQLRLMASLKTRLGAGEVIETPISRVLLAGDSAWKFKKPVNPGFLDFTTLANRLHFCLEEVRLNRRLAPDIYRGVLAFRNSPDSPVLAEFDGARPEDFEYAVHMARFPGDCLADRRLEEGRLASVDMDELARAVAAFHLHLPPADPDAGHGTPERIVAPVRRVVDILGRTLTEAEAQESLGRLDNWVEMSFATLAPLMEARRAQGFIRECHGDLHLGNIALLPAGPCIFDGIEFDPELRWIDIQSEAAFLVMDCASRGRADLGQRFLDGWLSITGDYEGVALLHWYAVYRALVRSMVSATRSGQAGLTAEEAGALRCDALAHVALADRFAHPPRPALLLMHGLSGSGKSWLSQHLLESLPAVRLRSDVERKRLFGLAERDRGDAGLLYGDVATEATYARLLWLTGELLAAGHHAVVDASFLRRADRDHFRAMAAAMGVDCMVLDCRVSGEVARRRVARRFADDRDASDADLAVLASQQAHLEPLGEDEPVLVVDTEAARPDEVVARLKSALRDQESAKLA